MDFMDFIAAERRQESSTVIVYSRAQLLDLAHAALLLPREKFDIPDELKRRRRGCRAGLKCKAKRRRFKYKPAIPSIIMGNVRCLHNKMDELAGLVRGQRIYREASLMCFTETWLNDNIPIQNVTIDGFQTITADRDRVSSGKSKGGGLALLVNNRWCHPNHITLKEQFCSPDIELLAVSLRPYYLPREFTAAIAVIVYIPPSADANAACDVIHSVIARLQTAHPSAFFAISGDFNHASLSSTLPTFKQFVKCPTRNNKTLDLLYANVKDAYNSTALPPLGRSDHNLVHLTPLYRPMVQQQPATTRTIRRWSPEANEALQDCFETTDWDVFCEAHGEDIDGLTDCITDYINFCVDNTVPTRKVRCFPNNKPWVTSDLKALLNEKKRAFKEKDKDKLKCVQRELKLRIAEGKRVYKEKMEDKLRQSQVREVWKGMRNITGFKKSNSGQTEGTQDRANELNQFFNRFDTGPVHLPSSSPDHTPSRLSHPHFAHSTSAETISDPTSAPAPPGLILNTPLPPTSLPGLAFTTNQVKRELERLHQWKAAGPDGISPRVLRVCADQLCGILQRLFNLSLSLERVPVLWKTSCLVPVPKKAHPTVLNDFRPVALTSHIMKTLERLVLAHLRPLVCSSMDPLQFAYQRNIGVDDAIIYLLQRAYSHLDNAGCTVRVMFFDFSSAFNTIQPLLLGEKMRRMKVEAPLVSWVTDYLTGRPQFVRLQSCVSERAVSNTGAPQGTVLSPFLFTLYTSDFRYNSETCHLQKFSDDSAIVGCIRGGQEEEYRSTISDFVLWCEQNHLQLNISKTKEMVVDFRRTKAQLTAVPIKGMDVEMVESYKFLGVHMDNRLEWAGNTGALYKKGQSRLYFLRRLRSFNVCSKLLHTFYQSVVASAIFFAVVCWGANIKAGDASRVNKLIRKASSVLGMSLDTLEEVAERRILAKLLAIMDNVTHPLHAMVMTQRSSFSHRLIPPRCARERHRRSFLPAAMRLYNASPGCRAVGNIDLELLGC